MYTGKRSFQSRVTNTFRTCMMNFDKETVSVSCLGHRRFWTILVQRIIIGLYSHKHMFVYFIYYFT